jgi:hypothetical protein
VSWRQSGACPAAPPGNAAHSKLSTLHLLIVSSVRAILLPANEGETESPMRTTARTIANWNRIYAMSFASIYELYIAKVEKKGRTKAEVDQVIRWLTGYTQKALDAHIAKKTTFEDFFAKATKLNPSRSLITGVICGVRVEQIEEPLMQNIRYMDKLVDELAKGRPMEKILRTAV